MHMNKPVLTLWRGKTWTQWTMLGLAALCAFLWLLGYWASVGIGVGKSPSPHGHILEVTTVTDGLLIVHNGTRGDNICYDGPTGYSSGPSEYLSIVIIDKIGGPHVWWPRIERPAPWCGPYTFVPLWIPLLAFTVLGLSLMLVRRPPPGSCTKCWYPLTGLSPDSRCPECGAESARTSACSIQRSSAIDAQHLLPRLFQHLPTARYDFPMLTKLLIAAAFTLPLSGCVAWEIRDEMRVTNRHLCEVTPALGHTIAMVEETNQKIAATNTRLDDVHASLARTQAQLTAVYDALRLTDENLVSVGGTLVETNPKLNSLDGGLDRMKILNDMHATLKEVNATLGPLNKAMGSLGGAVSFLGLSENSQDLLAEESTEPSDSATALATPSANPAAPTPAAGTPASGEAVVSSGTPGTPATPAASSRSGPDRQDYLLGTWVQVYPPPIPPETAGRVIILTADGKFITAQNNKPLRAGRWTRKERTFTANYDAAPGQPTPEPEVRDLLTLTSRTLTLRRGDEILVFARP